MDEQDNTASKESVTERLLRRLVAPPQSALNVSNRIDVVNNTDLDLLRIPRE